MTWHEKDTPYPEDQWELYHIAVDPTEFNDLAAAEPEKLAELQKLWEAEAEKNGVFPFDDRRYERVADPTRPVAAIPKETLTPTIPVHRFCIRWRGRKCWGRSTRLRRM